jgi:tRNA(adenine34) deaminase
MNTPRNTWLHMQKALEEARNALKKGEIPVGATLVHTDSNTLIASAHNRTTPPERLQQNKHTLSAVDSPNTNVSPLQTTCPITHTPLGHAEMLVILKGLQHTQSTFLTAYTLYVTLEPCAFCASAIALSRVGCVVFGAYNPKGGALTHGPRIIENRAFSYTPQVIEGVSGKTAEQLLKNYFSDKRS